MLFFARPIMQRLNTRLTNISLRARGFNNCCDPQKTGERHFLNRLTREQLRVCVDVGANVGEYSSELLKAPNSIVIAFEPVLSTFELLCRLKTKYGARFLPVNCALGDETGTLPIHYGEKLSLLATLAPEVANIELAARTNTRTSLVSVRTLDDVLEAQFKDVVSNGIDLIKIDVEGYEERVLRGAQSTIAKYKPRFVQIEFNTHHLFLHQSIWGLSRLMEGYTCYQLLPYGWHAVDPAHPLSNIFLYSNFVFQRQ